MKVAIIGTGTLGPSIAQVFSQCEQVEKIFLCKGREYSRSNGKDKITKAFEKLVAKENISREQADLYLEKLSLVQMNWQLMLIYLLKPFRKT